VLLPVRRELAELSGAYRFGRPGASLIVGGSLMREKVSFPRAAEITFGDFDVRDTLPGAPPAAMLQRRAFAAVDRMTMKFQWLSICLQSLGQSFHGRVVRRIRAIVNQCDVHRPQGRKRRLQHSLQTLFKRASLVVHRYDDVKRGHGTEASSLRGISIKELNYRLGVR
jgi:hypothetical protein